MIEHAKPLKVAVVYHSSFKGATEQLAKAAARGAARIPDVQVTLVSVADVADHWDDLHTADCFLFGSPTYVGSVSAGFKTFIEMCAGDVWLQRQWLNKVAGCFTVSAGRSGDKLNCLQDLAIFIAQMGMALVPMRITGGNYSTQGSEADLNRMAGYLGVMAQANIDEPPELAPPPSDIATMELHAEHVATFARQYAFGRRALPAQYDQFSLTPAVGRPRSLREF
jgi:NAD(P)H dehydrogenase (quinone)